MNPMNTKFKPRGEWNNGVRILASGVRFIPEICGRESNKKYSRIDIKIGDGGFVIMSWKHSGGAGAVTLTGPMSAIEAEIGVRLTFKPIALGGFIPIREKKEHKVDDRDKIFHFGFQPSSILTRPKAQEVEYAQV